MIRLRILDKEYKIIDNFTIKSSNNEVTFNSIKIDFSEGNEKDIPFKYQEVNVIENGNCIFTGYVDTIKLNKVTDELKELTINLMSPLKLATKRVINLVGTYSLENAIKRVLQPLIDDGYTLAELNVPKGQITTSFVFTTIESAMNTISTKRSIFWYINPTKMIYVNSIDYLFGKTSRKVITEQKEKGLLDLSPTISNIDYANVINFKNVRLIYSNVKENENYPIANINIIVKNGDIVNFINPIVFREDTLRTKMDELDEDSFMKTIDLQMNSSKYFEVGIRNSGDPYKIYTNLSYRFDDEEGEADIVFYRDAFFYDLITGFRWNLPDDVLKKLNSDTALRYTTMKYLNSKEINSLKGIISRTGQIERVEDYKEQWTTVNQLIDYAKSLINENSNVINEITFQYDINPNLEIGDIIEVYRPAYFIDGKFAIKSIKYSFYNDNHKIWTIVAKKTDFVSSYTDLFRTPEQQESARVIDTVLLSEYVEEAVTERHEVVDMEVLSDED